jgi:hypothetical protein
LRNGIKNGNEQCDNGALRIYDFGGMYGSGENVYNNPATEQKLSFGIYFYHGFRNNNIDNGVFFCYRPATENPLYDFGGMYGSEEMYTITLNGARSCPSDILLHGFGTTNIDNGVFFCYRPATENPLYDFGGMYGYGNPNNYINPATGGLSCPPGYTFAQVLGTSNLDYPIYFCYKNHAENPNTNTPCVASNYGETCSYCDTSCNLKTVWRSCGDSVQNSGGAM